MRRGPLQVVRRRHSGLASNTLHHHHQFEAVSLSKAEIKEAEEEETEAELPSCFGATSNPA